MEKGLDFFHRAIELDPNFVAPYLGIADSLSMMRNDPEDWRQAEEYARKALAINSGSADAHASLGFILAMNRWQWSEAEAELQNAIALDGNSGKAHQWYATVLEIERRFPEAEIHLKRAIEIEPLSPNYNIDLCELYLFAGRYDEAFEQCRRTNEINPDFPLADARMHIYLQQKRYDEAAQVSLENAMRLGATESEVKRQGWYQAYLKNGFRGWMQYNIDSNKGRSDILLTSYELSLSHAQMGDKEKSLLYLEQCYAGHAFLLPFANARPEYDFLRDDPRFRNMMARIGLPQN
jgi:tetratricopeptide (TPR) repeat protein